ncbi:MAG TPA: L-serine ammonia-lyase, iron-sulfur-dependent, subunit alpha [Caproiciproducens sp.]|nr:L-serine ammonia-lyase, iron-sulfur-dependent, subunit alpha [Caproiciproducens sp.]
MSFNSGAALAALCAQNKTTISEEMIRREIRVTGSGRDEILQRMAHSYEIMKSAVRTSLTEDIHTVGGLIGGEAKKLYMQSQRAKPVCGSIMAKAAAYAMGVLEVNASMGLIVAAPTAGSSGVIPGAFLALQEELGFSDNQMTGALFNAGAVGYLITRNATVSGAEGGCQAEVGTASAMAASAAAELMGGTPGQCLDAASMAIGNLLGLVCDPVAGLVEAPCQKRNALGVSNALVCAQTALSGIPGLIPFDEIVDAMYRVGRSLPTELRETAQGGCAATPTGCQLCKSVFH